VALAAVLIAAPDDGIPLVIGARPGILRAQHRQAARPARVGARQHRRAEAVPAPRASWLIVERWCGAGPSR
jgi:hypothetical protein